MNKLSLLLVSGAFIAAAPVSRAALTFVLSDAGSNHTQLQVTGTGSITNSGGTFSDNYLVLTQSSSGLSFIGTNTGTVGWIDATGFTFDTVPNPGPPQAVTMNGTAINVQWANAQAAPVGTYNLSEWSGTYVIDTPFSNFTPGSYTLVQHPGPFPDGNVYNIDGSHAISLTVVPEPSIPGILASACGLGLLMRRRSGR